MGSARGNARKTLRLLLKNLTVDGLLNFCPVLDYVAKLSGSFQLVDIGCSGGIDRQWRRLGRRLRAVGIDPDVREIERLRGREKNPAITYLNAFAGIAAGHPFAMMRAGKPDLARNPWQRLSTPRYLELIHSKEQPASDKEKRSANLWEGAELADANRLLIVPEYLEQQGVGSVDFLKIDVDGKDFDVLNSFDDALAGLGALGVGVEVRFWGSHEETDGTFHNVDRFLKARGFELFNLTIRRYSTSALPSRFHGRAPGATEYGRVHQGDAMYARDLGSELYVDFEQRLSQEKLLNLIAIFAVFDLPDCAAEVALKFRAQLASVCDVDHILDLLTAQAEGRIFGGANYPGHKGKFDGDPRSFLGTKNPVPHALRNAKKGYLKWRGRMQLLAMERKAP